MQNSLMTKLNVNALSKSYPSPEKKIPAQYKGHSDSDLSPSHRTFLESKLGGKMHAGGKTEWIGI